MCAKFCKNRFRYSQFPQMAFTLASLAVNTILSLHESYIYWTVHHLTS